MACEREVDAKAKLRGRGNARFRLASLRNIFSSAGMMADRWWSLRWSLR